MEPVVPAETLSPVRRDAKASVECDKPLSGTAEARAIGLPGIPGGVEMELFSQRHIEIASEALIEKRLSDAREDLRPSNAECLDADLQRDLDFSGSARGAAKPYEPAISLLVGRRVGAARRNPAVTDIPEDIVCLSDRQLAQELHWLWKHRGRGLSDRDLLIQREWEARSAGHGLLSTLTGLELPSYFWPLCGDPRAVVRRKIVRMLQICDARGYSGFVLSSAEAEDLEIGSESSWWRAIAWLEDAGLLVRLRTYKRGTGERKVETDKNWYGPGPKLIELRTVYLAGLGVEVENGKAHLEQYRSEYKLERKKRAGERRRRRVARKARYEEKEISDAWKEPEDWQKRPEAMVVLVDVMREAKTQEALEERARKILKGDISLIGQEDEVLPLDPEQERALEEAVLGPSPTCNEYESQTTKEAIGIPSPDTLPFGEMNSNQEEEKLCPEFKFSSSQKQTHPKKPSRSPRHPALSRYRAVSQSVTRPPPRRQEKAKGDVFLRPSNEETRLSDPEPASVLSSNERELPTHTVIGISDSDTTAETLSSPFESFSSQPTSNPTEQPIPSSKLSPREPLRKSPPSSPPSTSRGGSGSELEEALSSIGDSFLARAMRRAAGAFLDKPG